MICLECHNPIPYFPDRDAYTCLRCGEEIHFDIRDLLVDPNTRVTPGVRQSQVEMAEFIDERLTKGAITFTPQRIAVEAPVGVGKTFGYLVSTLNRPGRVIISTATTNLQTQIHKSLKVISDKYCDLLGPDHEFSFHILKGGSHYVCADELDDKHINGHITDDQQLFAEQAIQDLWCSGKARIEEFPPSVQSNEALYSLLQKCRGTHCAPRTCTHVNECGYRYIRRAATTSSRVIIVNHALLARMIQLFNADLQGGMHARGSLANLLAQTDHVVIDEAHEFVGYLRNAYATEFTSKDLERAARIASDAPNLDAEYRKEEYQLAHKRLAQWVEVNKDLSSELFSWVAPEVSAQKEAVSYLAHVITYFEAAHRCFVDNKERKRADKLLKAIKPIKDFLDSPRSFKTINTYKGTTTYASKNEPPKSHIQYAFSGKNLVLTSGTLLHNKKIDHISRELGLDFPEENVVEVSSSFDYKTQSTLYVAPDPSLDPRRARKGDYAFNRYTQKVGQYMSMLVEITNGHAFLLFSSRREMESVLEQLTPLLRNNGHKIFVQERGLSTEKLAKDFESYSNERFQNRTAGPVLFGMNSFWHGVSVEGPALQLVAVCKLSFPRPDDPQVRFMKSQEIPKGIIFSEYIVPEATKRLEQAEGRLIRTKNDFGIFAILDSRLKTVRYGKRILNSMRTSETLTYDMNSARSSYQASRARYEDRWRK